MEHDGLGTLTLCVDDCLASSWQAGKSLVFVCFLSFVQPFASLSACAAPSFEANNRLEIILESPNSYLRPVYPIFFSHMPLEGYVFDSCLCHIQSPDRG